MGLQTEMARGQEEAADLEAQKVCTSFNMIPLKFVQVTVIQAEV